jgi:GNAT superfamily N-acetyltransferase
LNKSDRCALHQHFAQLSDQDLMMRFGRRPDADWLALVVDGFDFTRDSVLGVRDGELLAGVAHLALFDGAAELGLSVIPSCRRRGIGTALWVRAAARARDHGVRKLYIRDLPSHPTFCHMARRTGMQIHHEGPPHEVWVDVPPGLDHTQTANGHATAGLTNLWWRAPEPVYCIHPRQRAASGSRPSGT